MERDAYELNDVGRGEPFGHLALSLELIHRESFSRGRLEEIGSNVLESTRLASVRPLVYHAKGALSDFVSTPLEFLALDEVVLSSHRGGTLHGWLNC